MVSKNERNSYRRVVTGRENEKSIIQSDERLEAYRFKAVPGFEHTLLWENRGKSELIGDLLQDEEQAEDGPLEQFLKRQCVQFTAEESTEDLDARGGPRGEVGEGAFFNLGAFAEGLAKEDGRGRVAVGDQVDKHGH